MKTLVVGASGATGKWLVQHLLERGGHVTAVLREGSDLPEAVQNHPSLSVVRASLLDLSDMELAKLVEGCDAIASCLGHNLSFKGLFLPPRNLVRDSVKRLCQASQLHQSGAPVKFVLMNTTAVRNHDLTEAITGRYKTATFLLRYLLPPHADNEKAAAYLKETIGQNHANIQWVSVRPDGLIDEQKTSVYDVYPALQRDPMVDAGQTSRINVAHFMAELILDDNLWEKWKGQMPVIYNREHDH